jgi:membrane protein
VDRARRWLDPERPTAPGAVIRAGQRYVTDGMPDRAASLAYYGMLSLFPVLMLAIAVVRLVGGSDAPDDLTRYAEEHGASSALGTTLHSALDTAESASQPSAGALGVAGLLLLIYGASRAYTAAGRALDAADGRPFQPRSAGRRLRDVGWTVLLILLAVVFVVLVLVSGRVLRELLGLIGLSGFGVTVWGVLRWPAAALLLLVAFATVRATAPTAPRRFRLFSIGSVVTAGIWLGASAGYALYLATIATYNATYGAFAGAVILLLWIWLSAAALLYGAELDVAISSQKVNWGADPGEGGS